MRAIAADAGVAERTVYLAFPTKAQLLDEIIGAAIRGADELLPYAALRAAVLAAPPKEMLDRFGEAHAAIMARAARVIAIGEAAARIDPELAAIRDRSHAAMRTSFEAIAAELHNRGALAAGITTQEAAATIYAVASDATYLRLVDGYAWTPERYGRWLAQTLRTSLGRD
jgi:AcrR family transcriptional regulator